MRTDDKWLSTLFDHERWDLSASDGDIQRILVQVQIRRRRRLLLRGLGGLAVAGLVGAVALVAVSWPETQQEDLADRGFLPEPVLTGPLPEVGVRAIPSLEQLPDVLPGTTVETWDLTRWQEPLAVDPSGRVYVQTNDGLRDLTRAPHGGWAYAPKPLAELELPIIRDVVADNDTVLWTEVSDDEPAAENVQAVTRCLDRTTGEVHTMAWPERNSVGLAYEAVPSDLVVASGHIVIEVRRTGGLSSVVDATDLYTADSCGGRLERLAERAAWPRASGDWLYYVQGETVWRTDLDGRGRPEIVMGATTGARGVSPFTVTEDALVWGMRRDSGLAVTLLVARPDGSYVSTMPTDLGMQPPTAASRQMVAGAILHLDDDDREPRPDEPISRGMWMYFPSRGAIVTLDTPPAEYWWDPLRIDSAAGDYLLFAERQSPVGDVERAWLVKVP